MSEKSTLDGILKCPECDGDVDLGPDAAVCRACKASYEICDGVLLMLQLDPSEREGLDTKTREAYEARYQKLDNAKRYNAAYKQKFGKRWSTTREHKLLTKLLAKQPRSERLLDLPCGGGRLTPALEPFATTVIEADVAVGQVLHSKQSSGENAPRVWMTASALNIPLRDGSVDGVVCCRLNHHIPNPADRDQLVRELLRVSKRFVIMTYFDFHSIKNTIRRIRRPFNKKLPKMTMTRRRLSELAAEQNARVEAAPWLAVISSGHRYALIVKTDA